MTDKKKTKVAAIDKKKDDPLTDLPYPNTGYVASLMLPSITFASFGPFLMTSTTESLGRTILTITENGTGG